MALTTETLNNKKLSNKTQVDLTAKYKRMSQQKKLKNIQLYKLLFLYGNPDHKLVTIIRVLNNLWS